MDEISYFEAWASWIRGDAISSKLLWGCSILWWGRIGKMVGLVSALTILAEIVGPQRLRQTGTAMHGHFELRRTGQYIFSAARWTLLMWKDLLSRPGSKAEREARDEANQMGADNLNFVVMPLAGVIVGIIVGLSSGWWSGLVAGFFVLVMGFFTIGPILTTSIIITVMIAATLLDLLFIEPLAWTLEHKHLGTIIKVASVILLLLGFHFDFLAS